MLRVHFTLEDLSRITIATNIDVLWEVLLSLHLLQERDTTLAFGEWRRRVRAARISRVRLLLELASPSGYSPDFLTPGRGDADVPTLLDRVLSTPCHRLRTDLAHLTRQQPSTAWTRLLAAGDRAALNQLEHAIKIYYQAGLAPYCAQIQAHVAADRKRRSDMLLAGGLDQLLANLHPRVLWQPPVLHVLDYVDQDLHLSGRGLVLLPSFFCRHHPITLYDPTRPPLLLYPVTPGLGWLNPGDHTQVADPLTGLLGRTRATALQACIRPRTTTDLACHLSLSLAAASRQASVLRDAGLITTGRDGGTVIHHITALGISLLNRQLPP